MLAGAADACGASVGIELIAVDARPDTVEVTVEKTLPAIDMAEKGLLSLSFSLALSFFSSFALSLASYSALIFAISSWLTFSGSPPVPEAAGGDDAVDEEEAGSKSLVAKCRSARWAWQT